MGNCSASLSKCGCSNKKVKGMLKETKGRTGKRCKRAKCRNIEDQQESFSSPSSYSSSSLDLCESNSSSSSEMLEKHSDSHIEISSGSTSEIHSVCDEISSEISDLHSISDEELPPPPPKLKSKDMPSTSNPSSLPKLKSKDMPSTSNSGHTPSKTMFSIFLQTSFVLIVLLLLTVPSVIAGKRHVISFRSPNLFPEGVVWDRSAQRFLVGSLRRPGILAVSDTGAVETLISDPDLPANISVLGLSIDSVNRRLLAVVHAAEPHPPFDALAAYDLRSGECLFLSPLSDADDAYGRPIANDVTVDFNGNAYVTNAAGNFIWKVTADAEPSIFSRSDLFTSQKVYEDQPWSFCGLNGIAYVNKKEYLLAVQSNTGKMFKVDAGDGTATLVSLPVDLTAADGIAVRSDGVVVVVSQHKAWLLKSENCWGEGVVYDEIALDASRFATTVAVKEDDRAYVLYGHVDEGMMGNVEREVFGIEEIESKKGSGEETVWVFGLIGLGYALYRMRQLVRNMKKKMN